MATIHVRNVPDDMYEKIQHLAAENHRSVSAQIIMLIDRALQGEVIRQHHAQALRGIADIRKRLKPIPGEVDSLTLLREDRER